MESPDACVCVGKQDKDVEMENKTGDRMMECLFARKRKIGNSAVLNTTQRLLFSQSLTN